LLPLVLLLLLLLLLLLQEGEAPEEVRAVLQQRSRWAKGHFQVFFSRHCPLFHPKLNMLQRVLYTNGGSLAVQARLTKGLSSAWGSWQHICQLR
jgi:cellulose synthase/poly-beta-1,6-N-acetylglucosamine synthase-like glycosyltransferase